MTKARYKPVVVVGDRIRHVDGVWEVTDVELTRFDNGSTHHCYLYTMRLVEGPDGTPILHGPEWAGGYDDLPGKFIVGDGKWRKTKGYS